MQSFYKLLSETVYKNILILNCCKALEKANICYILYIKNTVLAGFIVYLLCCIQPLVGLWYDFRTPL